ncbi:MAG: ABC transporter ATP-binding protein [Planctomycetota bacterium]
MILLERFEKRYGKTRAVQPLDLAIEEGESFALLGPNGSGKTTILRAIVGLHAPTSGRVLVGGIDVARAPDRVKELLAYVPQRVTMPEMLSAREVLGLFARLKGAPEGRVDEMLERFALAESADRRILELSGGMLQRLGLAAAFLREVPLYVLDEPTVNLDPLGIERLRELLSALRHRGRTIVFSSHLLLNTMQLADRVAVLVEGQLATLEEVPAFRDAVSRRTTVRMVLRRTTDSMIEAARDAGAEVSDRNGNQISFRADPPRRLEVIRAIELAGGTIEEFHTEAPDWEALIRRHFDGSDR